MAASRAAVRGNRGVSWSNLCRPSCWRGITCVEGIVLHDNFPMIELAKSLGFHVRHDYAQQVVVISQSLEQQVES